jgi:hypothetical protein
MHLSEEPSMAFKPLTKDGGYKKVYFGPAEEKSVIDLYNWINEHDNLSKLVMEALNLKRSLEKGLFIPSDNEKGRACDNTFTGGSNENVINKTEKIDVSEEKNNENQQNSNESNRIKSSLGSITR